jgi:neutral ceramidase
MMSTLTNGLAQTGYIPSDEAFRYRVFAVLGWRQKPGCAEGASAARRTISRRVA